MLRLTKKEFPLLLVMLGFLAFVSCYTVVVPPGQSRVAVVHDREYEDEYVEEEWDEQSAMADIHMYNYMINPWSSFHIDPYYWGFTGYSPWSMYSWYGFPSRRMMYGYGWYPFAYGGFYNYMGYGGYYDYPHYYGYNRNPYYYGYYGYSYSIKNLKKRDFTKRINVTNRSGGRTVGERTLSTSSGGGSGTVSKSSGSDTRVSGGRVATRSGKSESGVTSTTRNKSSGNAAKRSSGKRTVKRRTSSGSSSKSAVKSSSSSKSSSAKKRAPRKKKTGGDSYSKSRHIAVGPVANGRTAIPSSVMRFMNQIKTVGRSDAYRRISSMPRGSKVYSRSGSPARSNPNTYMRSAGSGRKVSPSVRGSVSRSSGSRSVARSSSSSKGSGRSVKKKN